MARNYRHVTRFVSDQVWAIREGTLDIMVELLRMRASGITLTEDEIQARIGAARTPTYTPAGTVAVLPLAGVIAPKISAMTAISGGTGLDGFMKSFRKAVADPSVGAVVAEIDSPGGSVFGLQEAFDEIYKARGVKPLVAQVNPQAASAALWIASAFSEIAVTPSGEIGSLGVFAVHEDWSAANEKLGVKPTYISAGKYKVEGNPDAPLADEARDHMQARVDGIYAEFLNAVARGRDVSVSVARKDFGEGRMLTAKEAKAVKLADRVQTLEQTLARLSGRGASSVRAEDGHVDIVGVDFAMTTFEDVTGVAVLRAEPGYSNVHEAQYARLRQEIRERWQRA